MGESGRLTLFWRYVCPACTNRLADWWHQCNGLNCTAFDHHSWHFSARMKHTSYEMLATSMLSSATALTPNQNGKVKGCKKRRPMGCCRSAAGVLLVCHRCAVGLLVVCCCLPLIAWVADDPLVCSFCYMRVALQNIFHRNQCAVV